MKLYSADRAPSPRRTLILMREKGVNMDEVEIINLDLGKGENLEKAYRQKNPMGRVPMLELDDGTCLAENNAIARYFEETIPEPPLLGHDAKDRAIVEMWATRMEMHFFLPVGMAFRNISGFFKDRETPVKEWGEECFKNAQKMYGFLDKHLGNSEYIAGDNFTVADITALCTVDFSKVIKLGIGEDQKNLQRWYDTVSSRPSMKT